jgi:hypothetical protein
MSVSTEPANRGGIVNTNLVDRRSQPMVNQPTNVGMIPHFTGPISEAALIEYDEYPAGLSMNSRPDGSLMNW